MTHRKAEIVCRIGVPSKVAGVRDVVEGIVGQIVTAVESPERAVVVELPRNSARRRLLMIGAEVAAISCIGKSR
jgi:hypothetical protein